jgi:hypothetical protein
MISGHLRPNEHPGPASQQFTIFLVEVAKESAARTLLDLSATKKTTGNRMLGIAADYYMLGLAEGRLFCLVVARSVVLGGKSFEASDSLVRFSKVIAGILHRYAGKT